MRKIVVVMLVVISTIYAEKLKIINDDLTAQIFLNNVLLKFLNSSIILFHLYFFMFEFK